MTSPPYWTAVEYDHGENPWSSYEAYLADMTHPRRTMTIDEAANVAAFVASDRASGLTGTVVNLTMGSLDD